MKTPHFVSINFVENKTDSYPIYVGSNLSFADLLRPYVNNPISSASAVLIITNEILAPLYLEKIQSALEDKNYKNKKIIACVLPDGERSKSLETFTQIIEILLKENFHRDSMLIALGGGVIGDLTGFVAASFMRGIPWIQIPTSLLAQVDASVGGKTGINHPLGKNMIGVFYQPKAVLIDVRMLSTLPRDQFEAGMAEVIKHALIADETFVDFLLENREKILSKEENVLEKMILWSCKIKASIVEKDEKEQNLRAILNFGHTLGHALEASSNYEILHGYAVSIGMFFALKLSSQWAHLPPEKFEKSVRILRAFNLPEKLSDLLLNKPLNISLEQLLLAMNLDKKHKENQWKYILLRSIAHPVIYPVEPGMPVLQELLIELLREQSSEQSSEQSREQ